jgi:uncharacterized membrane protein (DUF2068 family)
MDWSLLGCGAGGHVTFAPETPPLRQRLSVSTREGAAWRCLRCGTFVIGEPTAAGPVSAAPRVLRGKELRSALILRLFAIERFARAVIFGVLAYAIWRFKYSRLSIEQAYNQDLPALRALLRELGFNVNNSKLLGLIQHAFTLNAHTLAWLALAAAGYAVIELIEAVGLWLLKRWGEYFAMVATSIGIPYEVYELTAKVTVLRLVAFAINLALVIYLVVSKRLLGVRGGKKAYEARRRSASILQSAIDDAAAEPARPGVQAGQPAAARPSANAGQPAGVGQPPGAGQPPKPDRPTGPGQPPGAGQPPAAGQPTDAAATSSSAAE